MQQATSRQCAFSFWPAFSTSFLTSSCHIRSPCCITVSRIFTNFRQHFLKKGIVTHNIESSFFLSVKSQAPRIYCCRIFCLCCFSACLKSAFLIKVMNSTTPRKSLKKSKMKRLKMFQVEFWKQYHESNQTWYNSIFIN